MSIFNFLGFKSKKTASSAKERLQIVVSHQRYAQGRENDFLQKLREDMLTVLGKYFEINPTDVNVELDQKDSQSVLTLNVSLPES